MAAFSQLPTELVELIASYLAQHDLYTVSRVNKSLNTLVGPYMYQHVDLVIQTGEKMPRIDRFCQNILDDPRRAARIETLRLGPSSEEGVKEGQRWLPRDKFFNDEAMYSKALTVLDNEPLITSGDYLRDAILQREYSAYAVLIVLTASAIQQLDISDFKYSTMDRLHTILRNLGAERPWNERHASPALLERLTRIKAVSCNVDRRAGLPYQDEKGQVYLDEVLNLPGLESLEFSVTDTQAMMTRAFNPAGMTHWPSRLLTTRTQPTALTKMIVRYSTSSALAVRPLLGCTPQLSSLTWDIAYDCHDRNEAPESWIDLDAWNASLGAVSRSLETLVFAAEYFDSGKFSFEQPKIGIRQLGYLDLTSFERLHTLEVPIPFLTGDADFSITADIYPLLPPYLRHLSLRVDLSLAQLSYQLDTSILSTGLTLQQSQAEARCAMSARMDLSYLYHATIAILDYAPALESISVWQPADPSLAWFDGQVADFATTCSNKSVTGILLYPMLLRWKKPEHRDLAKEVKFEAARADPTERLCRGERAGIPLGLASQFHLRALRSHLVRRH